METVNRPEQRNHTRSVRFVSRIGCRAVESTLDSEELRLLEDIGHRTHDPLASVRVLLELGDTEQAFVRNKTEFITDQAERSPNKPFNTPFTFQVVGDRFISSTGMDLEDLIWSGIETGYRDIEIDPDKEYGQLRNYAQLEHVPALREWYASDSDSPLLFASLCPEETEVVREVAKKNGFKPANLMASIWVFSKHGSEVSMQAFSMDGMTLNRLHATLSAVGCDDVDAFKRATTLEQLRVPIELPGVSDAEDAAEFLINAYDVLYSRGQLIRQGRLQASVQGEASSAVAQNPAAFELYMRITKGIKVSLLNRQITEDLRSIMGQFSAQLPPSLNHITTRIMNHKYLSVDDARECMEFIRSQAIPEALFSIKGLATKNTSDGGSKYSGFAVAGAVAVKENRSYEPGCPTSATSEQGKTDTPGEMGYISLLLRREVFESRYCPCCLPEPIKGVTVKAWKQVGSVGSKTVGKIGCGDCGQVQDICTGEVISRGKAIDRSKSDKNQLKKEEKQSHKRQKRQRTDKHQKTLVKS